MTARRGDSDPVLGMLGALRDDLAEHRQDTRRDFESVREDIAGIREKQDRRIGAQLFIAWVMPIAVIVMGIITSVALGSATPVG